MPSGWARAWWLPQQVLAAGERPEELVVQVVAVREHDQGRVGQRGLADEAPGREGHGQALAGALGMPDHPDTPVPGLAPAGSRLVAASRGFGGVMAGVLFLPRGAQGLAHGEVDGVELVVASHLLDEGPAPGVLEDDEVADEVQQPALVEYALDHHLEFDGARVRQALTRDRPPGLEPLLAGGQRAKAGPGAVGDDQQLVTGEERGELGLVGPQRVERGPDTGPLVGRCLQLEQGQGQTIDEDHHVQAAQAPVFQHRETG